MLCGSGRAKDGGKLNAIRGRMFVGINGGGDMNSGKNGLYELSVVEEVELNISNESNPRGSAAEALEASDLPGAGCADEVIKSGGTCMSPIADKILSNSSSIGNDTSVEGPGRLVGSGGCILERSGVDVVNDAVVGAWFRKVSMVFSF